MAASFSNVTVLMSPEVLFTGMIYMNLIREYLVWFLKVAGVDTGNIFRWRTMAASFSKVTVLISPEVLLTGMISVNYLIRRISGLVFEGSWCWYLEIFSDGERWQLRSPSVTVLISPEVLFTGMIYVNYLIREYLVWFLKIAGVDTRNIFRWRTMAASFSNVTVLISPEVLFTGMISVNYDTRILWSGF